MIKEQLVAVLADVKLEDIDFLKLRHTQNLHVGSKAVESLEADEVNGVFTVNYKDGKVEVIDFEAVTGLITKSTVKPAIYNPWHHIRGVRGLVKAPK
jgi:hypothetical protein